MFLAVVDGGLESLKRSLVNPFQSHALVLGNACATLIADPKVVHRLGVTLVGLLTIAVCFVSLLRHSSIGKIGIYLSSR